MSNMENEADLTAIELMRQILPRSQFFREYAIYSDDADPDEYAAADAALEQAQAEAALVAQFSAVNAYLDRFGGGTKSDTLAMHALVTSLAKKAVVFLMQTLHQKLGRLPTTEEMTAELDEWEMGNLEVES